MLKTDDIDSRIQDAGAPYERLIASGGRRDRARRSTTSTRAERSSGSGPTPKKLCRSSTCVCAKPSSTRGEAEVISPRRISLDDDRRRSGPRRARRRRPQPRRLRGRGRGRRVLGPVLAGPRRIRRRSSRVRAGAAPEARCWSARRTRDPRGCSTWACTRGSTPATSRSPNRAATPERSSRPRRPARSTHSCSFGADPIADFPDADLASEP